VAILYLESSALMKKYKREMGTELLYELFSAKADTETFVTSRLTFMETNMVLARNLKGKQLSLAMYYQMVDRIGRDFQDYIITMPMDNALVEEAMQLLPDYPLRAADALHFATARRAAAIVGDQSYYVVSSDRDLNDACVAYNLMVLNPIDSKALQQLREMR